MQRYLPPVLTSPSENAINSDFFIVCTAFVSAVFVLSGTWQLCDLFWSKCYGPYNIKYRFGHWADDYHKTRVSLVILAEFFLIVLWIESIESSFIQLLLVLHYVNLFVILPLQIYEPSRSSTALATPLFYWLFLSIWASIALVQDSLSVHKLLSSDTHGNLAEIGLIGSSILSLIFEIAFYKPTQELKEYYELNGWDIDQSRNLFSQLTFFWIQDVISKVYHTGTVEFEDLKPIPKYLTADVSSEKFQRAWDTKVKTLNKKAANGIGRPSLFLVGTTTFLPFLILGFLFGILVMITEFLEPFILQKFISFFTASLTPGFESQPLIIGFGIATFMFLNAVVRFFLFNQYFTINFDLEFSIESCFKSIIYNKALKLSPESRKNKGTGEILNSITTDIGQITNLFESLESFIITPTKLVICLYSVYRFVGVATLGGVIAAAISIPLTGLIYAPLYKKYPILFGYKDKRTTLTTEILTSIKSIKLYSWEKPMLKKLSDIRNGQELQLMKSLNIFQALAQYMWNSVPFFISVSSFYCVIYFTDIILTPDVVFPVLLLFKLLTEPVSELPNLFSTLISAKVSFKRITDLLLLEEVNDIVVHTNKTLKTNDISVKIENCTFVWTNKKTTESDEEATIENSQVALNNISFTAKKGQLTCVVGKVGSGKTTLFKCLLGEIPLADYSNGTLEVNGRIAYCPQSPWILNGSVKENILFGHKYDPVFYQKTIDACELASDFETLADGDSTIVGEKGISLSGGQKARISLARAVYSRSDVYFLDDVLSAVDSHVGKNLIDNVLGPNGIISSKTIILCTNSVPVLHKANEIHLLKKGEFSERGTYEEVMARDSDLAKLIKEFGKKENTEDKENSIKENENDGNNSSSVSEITTHNGNPNEDDPTELTTQTVLDTEALGDIITEEDSRLERVLSRETIGGISATSFTHKYDDDFSGVKKTGNNAEVSAKGTVKLGIFKEYFKSFNYLWVIVYLILLFSNYAFSVLERYVLTRWSDVNLKAGRNVDANFYLCLYLGCGILRGAFNFFASFILWSMIIIKAAKHFHDTMIYSVLRSPMRFFETTPVGRILNRFTQDMSVIDMNLPFVLMFFLMILSNGIITFSIIIYSLPVMGIVIFVLFFLYNYIRQFFIPSSRELKRFASASKSPQIAHMQESINGIDTVKAFNQIGRFIYKNKENIDKVITINYNSQCINRWLSMRLQFISAIILYGTAIMATMTLRTKTPISPALLGFLMQYALQVTQLLNSFIRIWAQVETETVAVERVVEYCNLKPEAPEIIEDNRPPNDWPNKGSITFSNYSTRYADNLDPVIKNINLSIKAQEKIGIVGRTGAGKSSLTLALFRIIEPLTGKIVIDDINSSEIGLSDLRKQLSIIPQDAQTVEGSVRDNLDPFNQYSDEQLWKALELANLKEHIEQMKTEPTDKEIEDRKKEGKEPPVTQYQLDAMIFEGGSNLSSGQKQLLCLARALLNPSKILLLDEATAAVDVETDKIIQKTIRSEFKDKTILVIAHRLETIMDSDRVIVLDKGEVKEFDSPQELLKNKESIFYHLCRQGGYIKDD